jgi:hypothetical protein
MRVGWVPHPAFSSTTVEHQFNVRKAQCADQLISQSAMHRKPTPHKRMQMLGAAPSLQNQPSLQEQPF